MKEQDQVRSQPDPSGSQIQVRPRRQPLPSRQRPALFSAPLLPLRLRWLRPRWPQSRPGRIIGLVLIFLLGVAVGLSALFWYGLSGEGQIVIVPQARSGQGNVIVEANAAFVTQLVRQDLANAGLPGEVRDVQVQLKHGAEMIISGENVNTVFGVTLSRHFTVYMQPYVKTCILQARVLRADLGGIPVTTFVQSLQGSINQQLAQKPSGLPEGFFYCTVGVRTEPGGLFITYQATPLPAKG